VEKEELAAKHPTRVIRWLQDKDLIVFSALSAEGVVTETRVVLGKRAKSLEDITTYEGRMAVLRSINGN